jgi:protoporphyrinogen oxidase
MIVILGAGLSGLSASYHLGHDRCLLLERNMHAFGHAASVQRDGFVWDIGPHVSFTNDPYVKSLFELSVGRDLEEIEVRVGNYYRGHWIDHPAQTSLHQVPQPERDACLASFLATRESQPADGPVVAKNYQQWLENAFGPVFANTFPAVYTRKYWTRPATELTTDWIGGRILYPRVEEVQRGATGPLSRSMHYISKIRYPRHGGYQSFAVELYRDSNIHFGAEVAGIDLKQRDVWLSDGTRIAYDHLVNTLPLPIFIRACRDAPPAVVDAAMRLGCTQLLLVNVAVPHASTRPEHWLYVYDDDKLSTRISCTEKLSPHNAPSGWTGIQTEVYFSRHRPLTTLPQTIGQRVEAELTEMGLIDRSHFSRGDTSHRHIHHAPWANVIFDHDTAPALETIWGWLESYGLERDSEDTHPLTDWKAAPLPRAGRRSLTMAGRFAQWKYYWSDDCILRGKRCAQVT